MTKTNENNNTTKVQVTTEQFKALQGCFDYYNKELFASQLPDVMLNFSRHTNAYGFFAPAQWHAVDDKGNTRHEISLNPDYLDERTMKKVISTLVHEMVHLWQEEFGHAPRRCYHNKEFAEMMESVGLITSSTGKAGGKRTGQKVSHYIMSDGKFDKLYDAMPKELLLPFSCVGLRGNKKKTIKKSSNTVAYICPICGARLRGKEGLNIKCVECDEFFLSTH